MITLKDYQETAVKELVVKGLRLLNTKRSGRLVFKSPTGSGKTIMMAEFLRQMVSQVDHQTPLSFIWAAPRALHKQSKDKLRSHYEIGNELRCAEFHELTGKRIAASEVLFLNWESINKTEKNTIVRENEQEFYLGKVLSRSRDLGHRLVLIIDESHHHATSDISQRLIRDMSPDLTIEVSATPTMDDPDEMVAVQIEDVREDGMIKSSVVLNADFSQVLTGSKVASNLSSGTDIFVLDQAMSKLAEIKRAYEEEDASVNPLLLIQLPDRSSDLSEDLREQLERHLATEYGLSVSEGTVAVYLSESKENLSSIARNDSPVSVMFFKQAIALGWDCPRASILVLFRDHKSLTFSIQTVGRIMRMAEPERGHYQNPLLNTAFVYTNLADISVNEDLARGYLSIHTSRKSIEVPEISLQSVYRDRRRERTRLSSEFTYFFMETARKRKLLARLDLEPKEIEAELLSEFEAKSIQALTEDNEFRKVRVGLDSPEDMQRLFDFFIINNLSPFFPEQRSVGRLKNAIYRFLRDEGGILYEVDQSLAFRVVLDGKNAKLFSEVIDEAKEIYISSVQSIEGSLKVQENWTFPGSLNFTGEYKPLEVTKSVMQPFFSREDWKSESAFIQHLEQEVNVHYWFKNGESSASFFAVPYSTGAAEKPFFVDFIVIMRNGKIGLFDTKSGQTIDSAKEKSIGLQNYIRQNPGTFGGIVTNSKTDYSGRWLVFEGHSAALSSSNLDNWINLEL